MKNSEGNETDKIKAYNVQGRCVGTFSSQRDFERGMVYGMFGDAFEWAQLLEQDVVNALLLFGVVVPGGSTVENAMFFLEQRSKETFGRLLTHLRNYADVPEEIDEVLTEALKRRNLLAHHFFNDEETKKAFFEESAAGRTKLVQRLAEDRAFFIEATHIFEEAIKPARDAYIGPISE